MSSASNIVAGEHWTTTVAHLKLATQTKTENSKYRRKKKKRKSYLPVRIVENACANIGRPQLQPQQRQIIQLCKSVYFGAAYIRNKRNDTTRNIGNNNQLPEALKTLRSQAYLCRILPARRHQRNNREIRICDKKNRLRFRCNLATVKTDFRISAHIQSSKINSCTILIGVARKEWKSQTICYSIRAARQITYTDRHTKHRQAVAHHSHRRLANTKTTNTGKFDRIFFLWFSSSSRSLLLLRFIFRIFNFRCPVVPSKNCIPNARAASRQPQQQMFFFCFIIFINV